ncbi:MAG: patatin-like phospholipase family protein [Cellvibrionaceae bacterium]|nr:patatin-like phospholipase family protein [Cellvibrionaceae bacterium]
MQQHVSQPRIGLALGGGGVKGLAHIAMLKVLDEFKITPSKIVGSSMGAILGALYASGLSGQAIEQRVKQHIILPGQAFKDIFQQRKHLLKWAKVFSFSQHRGGILAADGLFEHLFFELRDIDFKDLNLRFSAMATDYHTAEEVELDSGELLSAILASMAIPGVFAPVKRDQRLLIDGGTVNNLPCDRLPDSDLRIASDVITLAPSREPKASQALIDAVSIVLTHNTRQRINACPPDLLFKPDTSGIDVFDFLKIREALARGEEEAETFRKRLRSVIDPQID